MVYSCAKTSCSLDVGDFVIVRFVLFVCFVSTIFNEGAYLTYSIFHKTLKDVFLLFENVERASVPLLMLTAKQGNHWYHSFNVFGMTQPLSGIEPWTSRT